MIARRLLWFALWAMLVLPFCGQGASVAAGRVRLAGHVPEVVAQLTPLGQLPATTNLYLAIGLPARNQDELDELLRELQDPTSTNYHRYLTPQEVTARFGPTEQQYQSVIRFVQDNGLRVAGTHPNRLVLDVAGTVATMERAFQTTVRRYKHPTEAREFFAPDTEPSVPADLPVADMWGLSDYALPQPLVHQSDQTRITPLNYNGSGTSGSYRGTDFRNAYAAGSVLRGSGQTLAVAEFDGYYANDITAYEAACGYTNVPLQNVIVNGVSGTPGYSGLANAVLEVSLDIELAIAMAPGLSKVLVYEGSNPYDVFNRILTDNQAKQISCSWAWNRGPSFNWRGGSNKTLDSQLQQMAAVGQSFFQASGDSDAYTGSGALSTSSGPTPVDSVYVTSVGGTSLSMTGGGGAWSSESVWNWGNNIGSSGGVSPNYNRPSWQAAVDMSSNGGSTAHRNIPDVAMTADAIYVIYNNGGVAIGVGGTSCAAPLWAGLTALINQQLVGAGKTTAGFLNPALYAIGTGANYAACFHDITAGNNIGANTPGLFSAVGGYDLCTGWGTPNGTNLINALAPYPYVLTPPASQTATNGNNVSFSVSPGGQPPFAYAWRFNGTNLPAGWNVAGAASNLLTVSSVTATNNGAYSVVITNSYGSITSNAATLTVVFPPFFTLQPSSESVVAGGSALLSATASGASPLAYRWQQNGTNLTNGGGVSGVTSNVLALNGVESTGAGNYRLVVTNVFGSVTSTVAALTVLQPAAIATPPTPQTVQCGGGAAFTVTAAGTTPLSYQWSLDGAGIAGATGSSLSLTNVHLPGGTVAVVVTNLYGSTTSSAALTVQDTLPPVITLIGGNSLYVELGDAFSDPGATAVDACAGPVPVIASGAVNTNTLSTNTVTYTAGDGNGNTNSITRLIIVRDTTAPSILRSFTNLTLGADTNCTAAMPDVTGTNYILATDLSGAVTVAQNPGTNGILLLGTNTVVLTVSDASRNSSSVTNQIVVLDQTAPLILAAPGRQTNSVGASAAFNVVASACTPLSFQWFFNNAAVSGATNNTLSLSNLTTAEAGDYFAVATASGGSTTSLVAALTVDLLSSSVSLTASNNPSGFGDSVSFLATVTPTNATGTIQFFTNDIAFESEPLFAGQALSTNLASLPRGTNLITAIYSGDVNDLPSTNTLAQVVTNHPPSAAAAAFSRAAGRSLALAVTNLATYWSDVDGDTVSLADVGVSTNGVTLTNDNGTIVYFNSENVADQFLCTISDGYGGTNFQAVNISTLLPGIAGLGLNADASVRIELTGAPEATYIVETTTNLFPAAWSPLATNTMGTNGVWDFTDFQATNSLQGFYRLRLAP